MWEERERRAQRIRISVIVLAVSMLFVEWWSSDSRQVPGVMSAIDALFHDTPQSRPASTSSGSSGLPASTTRSDQPASVGTGGSGGGGSTGNPNYRVDPIVHSDPTVVEAPSHRDVKPEKRTPPAENSENNPTASKPVPCDSRQDAAREPTDAQADRDRVAQGTVPCDDASHDRGRNTSTPPAQ